MEQVKIFSGLWGENDFEPLQTEVNDWLAAQQNIEIISRQTTAVGGDGNHSGWARLNIVIFYHKRPAKK